MKTYKTYTNDNFEPIVIINEEHVPLGIVQDQWLLLSEDDFDQELNNQFKKHTVKEVYWIMENLEKINFEQV